VFILLEMVLVSWSLAIDEHGGHEDLRGSGRRSVIPYVHGRTELYCSSLPSLNLPICLTSMAGPLRGAGGISDIDHYQS
jgi:hypothetical protein